MKGLALGVGASVTSLAFTIAPLFLVVKVAFAHTAPPGYGLVAPPRTVEDDHVVLGHDDDDAPITPPKPKAAQARHVAPPPPPAAPGPLVEQMLRGRVARQLESLPLCRRAEGPEGRGVAEVRYAPEGTATVVLAPPYAGTDAGACVARRLAGAAQAFDGAGTVGLRITFEL